MRVHAVKKWHLAGLALVLLLAFFLRVGDGVASAHFRYDQGRISLLALEMATGEAFHWTGVPNSGGLPTSPIATWFYAILFFINDSAQWVTLVVACWNVIGVALLWWIGHRYWSPAVGLLAAMGLAVTPWAVIYSRSIWEPNILLPFVMLAVATGLYGYIENKTWAKIAFLPLLLLGIQIHYITLLLFPIYFGVLYAGRENITWRTTLLSIILGAMMMMPMIFGAVTQGNDNPESSGRLLARLQTIIDIWRAGPDLRSEPITQSVDFATGRGSEVIQLNQASTFLTDFAPQPIIPWQIFMMLIGIGLVMTWRSSWRRYSLLLFIWVFFLTLSQIPAWTGAGSFAHYYIANLPVYSLLMAIGVMGLYELTVRFEGYFRYIAMIFPVMLIALFLWQGLWTHALLHRMGDVYSYIEPGGQTRTPLHYLSAVRDVLKDFDDVIIAGANPHESNYYVWEPMLYETTACVRDLLILDGELDILPVGRFAVLQAPLKPINPQYELPERYRHDNPITIDLRPGEDPYVIYPFESAPQWTESDIIDAGETAFENGVVFTGYALAENQIQLRWHILQAPGASYQYFVHFLDDTGERVGQRDAPFYVGQHWCKNDTLITTTSIELPENTTTLRIGMYRFKDEGGTESQFLRDNPQAKWVDIAITDD